MLKEVPYTIEEAEKAGGMGSYTLTSTRPLLPKDTEMTTSEQTVIETDEENMNK